MKIKSDDLKKGLAQHVPHRKQKLLLNSICLCGYIYKLLHIDLCIYFVIVKHTTGLLMRFLQAACESQLN